MPIQNGKYINPGWVNDTNPALNATEMNAISDTLALVPIANGGTGGATVAAARYNLGLGNTSGAVPIANGGTAATTAAQARTNLGITPANIGAVSKSGDTINGDLVITGSLEVDSFSSNTIIPIENGGTGGATVAAARANLGLGNTSGALPIANGGTGATTAADARTNLGITPSNLGVADYVTDVRYVSTGLNTSAFDGDGAILYQKWYSGKLEMWGKTKSRTNANITTSDWGGYVSQYMTVWGTWPVQFAAAPTVYIDITDVACSLVLSSVS